MLQSKCGGWWRDVSGIYCVLKRVCLILFSSQMAPCSFSKHSLQPGSVSASQSFHPDAVSRQLEPRSSFTGAHELLLPVNNCCLLHSQTVNQQLLLTTFSNSQSTTFSNSQSTTAAYYILKQSVNNCHLSTSQIAATNVQSSHTQFFLMTTLQCTVW